MLSLCVCVCVCVCVCARARTRMNIPHNGIILSHKKEWDLAICNNVDGTKGYYAKWNKPDRKRQISYLTYMWNLKHKWMNKETKSRNKAIENKLMVAKGRRVEKQPKWVKGNGRHRLPVMEWVRLMDERYSIRNTVLTAKALYDDIGWLHLWWAQHNL